MSDTESVWTIIWKHAARNLNPLDPFEIAEILLDVTRALGVSETDARRQIGGLLQELGRLPEGKRYFTRDGDAVKPLPEFLSVHKDLGAESSAYPFEI